MFNSYPFMKLFTSNKTVSKIDPYLIILQEESTMYRFKSKLLLVCILILILGSTHLAMGVASTPPENDDCANHKFVWNLSNYQFDTTNATFDGPGLYINSPNIWFVYKGRCDGCATVSLEGILWEVPVHLRGRLVQLRYEPFHWRRVEVWLADQFVALAHRCDKRLNSKTYTDRDYERPDKP